MSIYDGNSENATQAVQSIGYGANFLAQVPQQCQDRTFITISIAHYYGSGERAETRVERQFDGIPDRSDLEAVCEDAILGIGCR